MSPDSTERAGPTEHVSATATLDAPAEAVFAVLADPRHHAGIDGTGWVTAAVDAAPLTAVGQLFRMRMYHPDATGGAYETVNEVLDLVERQVLRWRTGHVDEAGSLVFGGWWWRYDLAPAGPRSTTVTLTHDWSEVGPGPRAYLSFPVFTPGHLDGSLRHLAGIVTAPPRPPRGR